DHALVDRADEAGAGREQGTAGGGQRVAGVVAEPVAAVGGRCVEGEDAVAVAGVRGAAAGQVVVGVPRVGQWPVCLLPPLVDAHDEDAHPWGGGLGGRALEVLVEELDVGGGPILGGQHPEVPVGV